MRISYWRTLVTSSRNVSTDRCWKEIIVLASAANSLGKEATPMNGGVLLTGATGLIGGEIACGG